MFQNKSMSPFSLIAPIVTKKEVVIIITTIHCIIVPNHGIIEDK
jgi:hypothetical protein